MLSYWKKLNLCARAVSVSITFILILGLAACSSSLDDASTDEGDEGVFACIVSGETVENCLNKQNSKVASVESENIETKEEFPALNDVPSKIKPSSTIEDLEKLSAGLVSDRELAKYTDERLRSSYVDSGSQGIQISRATKTDRAITSGDREVGALAATRIVQSGRQLELRGGEVRAGVMAVSEFQKLFNLRFSSSGRKTLAESGIGKNDIAYQADVEATEMEASDWHSETVQNTKFVVESEAKSGKGIVFQVASIPFGIGSAQLNANSRKILKDVVVLHKKYGGLVRVVGHASQRTRDMKPEEHQWVNFQLSLERATAVSLRLTRMGVPAEQLSVMAQSDNELLTGEHMPLGEAQNRRTDIYIEY